VTEFIDSDTLKEKIESQSRTGPFEEMFVLNVFSKLELDLYEFKQKEFFTLILNLQIFFLQRKIN
jgi:succinate dehydrogenase flavin-adding protein (antitoxin of CptAB toxin-antitoxin module)